MSDARVGLALRAVRLRRGLRQSDVALKAGVSAGMVSYLERGRLEISSLATLRRVAAALDIRVEVIARWRGGELDRLLNARHSKFAAAVIGMLNSRGWLAVPEVSFSIYGERGFIDILAWHAPSRSLLVIELKTQIVDAGELLGTLDRKTRLAAQIARDRGWSPVSVSSLLVVADSSTNRAVVAALDPMLRAALPVRGAAIRTWLRTPVGRVAGLTFFRNLNRISGTNELAGRQRVRASKTRSIELPARPK